MSKPNPIQPPDGEVVFRAASWVDEKPDESRQSQLDPTLLPLIGGFAVLLLLIIVLGNLSVRRLQDTSREALDIEHQHASKAKLLLQMRVALTRLDNEARDRMEADTRHELQPIFAFRLSTARGKVDELVPLLDHPPLSEMPKWRTFRGNLAGYTEITNDKTRYSQDGFAKFRDVDAELNELVHDSDAEQQQIFDQREAREKAATRSIRTWNLFAVLAGLLVAAATIWQVQRRFRQTRQSAEAARRERGFSTQMLEGMVSAIAAIDRHDRIRSANTAFFRIFPEATIGASIHSGIASPAGLNLLESVTASHVDVATYRGRWNLAIDSGAATFDVYSSPLEIDKESGKVLTLVDVTEAAKAEAELRHTESLTAVGAAAAQLAHEIKNPLGSIRLGVEMLREYAVNDDAVKTITLVERGIHHLNKLVVDVTQFSRRRQLERTEVDLRELLDSSLELVEDRVREKETPIERNYSADPIRGSWDAEQLREVLVNLLGNAIDASQPKSPVRISTELLSAGSGPATSVSVASVSKARALIRITDQGSGMDAKTQGRLFEPFFTTKKRGTGLGLSIASQIVDGHGGRIEVESELGKGTTFRIELPLKASDAGQ